ncbi:hypothetical protein KDW_04130 [Dictyobacter vulcani]|uniref:Uncharacterized protein n=1 Tax=Dictyobacter vulcani TaxID=2607529 RepID=A0A5J4KJB7_9CHLR|nr:hypothetical protein [Dictyobacter vulcani]GER86251.1 hypothetical protein KDW_04130 [Dictyobacter vulcani]
MDQLWYTWSTTGLGSVIGHRVRAASPRLLNLQDKVYQEIEKYLHYTLPDDINPYNITTASSPYSLAYIATERYGPLLMHRVYAGKDIYGRAGVFFIHVLANLNDITPLEVIDSWHSPFWQVRDSLLSAEQVELPAVQKRDLIAGSLSVATMMREHINQRHYQKNLEILVRTYLTLENWQNVYLETYAADGIHSAAERNAELIWGLLHCLPPYLAKQVTFSTYEGKLEDHPATQIVATCFSSLENLQREPSHPGFVLKWGYGLDGSLLLQEADIYQDQALQSSQSAEQLQACTTYAHATVEKFLSGNFEDWKAVQTFFDMTLSWKINNLSSFLGTYQLFSDYHFNTDNIKQILRPENAVVLLAQDSVCSAILSFLVKESPNRTTWWEDAGQRLWMNLATYATTSKDLPQILAKFATFLGNVIRIELIDGNQLKADAYLPVLEIIAPATQRPELWKQLLTDLAPRLQADEQQYPYELLGDDVYQIILKNCAYVRDISNEMVADWLHITWTDIESFCNWDIPGSWKVKAIVRLILHNQDKFPVDVDLVAIISAVQIYYEQALVELAHGAAPLAIYHLKALSKNGYMLNSSAVDRLLQAHCLDVNEIALILKQTGMDVDELHSLFLQHWEYLLLVAPDQAIVQDCVEHFLRQKLDISILKAAGTGAVLDTVFNSEQCRFEERVAAKNWCLIRQTLLIGREAEARKLVTNEQKLHALAEAITVCDLGKKSTYWDAFFQYITPAIQDEDDLHRILETIAPVCLFSIKTNSIYFDFIESIAPYVSKSDKVNNNPQRLLIYLQYVIARNLDQKEIDHNFKRNEALPRIFQQLLQNADKKIFDYINDKRVWGTNEWKIWKKYLGDVRPDGPNNIKRFFPGKKETVKIVAITPDHALTYKSKLQAPVAPVGLAAYSQFPQSTVKTVPTAPKNPSPVNIPMPQAKISLRSSEQHVPSSHMLPDSAQALPDISFRLHPYASSEDEEYVAYYGFIDGEMHGITLKDFQRIDKLKIIYFDYVADRNKNRPAHDKLIELLRDHERERLAYHRDESLSINASINLLARQQLFYNTVSGFDFYGDEKIVNKINNICKKCKEVSSSYRKFINNKLYSEDDLRIVIEVFIQEYWLDYCFRYKGGISRWFDNAVENHPYTTKRYKNVLERYRQQKKR